MPSAIGEQCDNDGPLLNSSQLEPRYCHWDCLQRPQHATIINQHEFRVQFRVLALQYFKEIFVQLWDNSRPRTRAIKKYVRRKEQIGLLHLTHLCSALWGSVGGEHDSRGGSHAWGENAGLKNAGDLKKNSPHRIGAYLLCIVGGSNYYL